MKDVSLQDVMKFAPNDKVPKIRDLVIPILQVMEVEIIDFGDMRDCVFWVKVYAGDKPILIEISIPRVFNGGVAEFVEKVLHQIRYQLGFTNRLMFLMDVLRKKRYDEKISQGIIILPYNQIAEHAVSYTEVDCNTAHVGIVEIFVNDGFCKKVSDRITINGREPYAIEQDVPSAWVDSINHPSDLIQTPFNRDMWHRLLAEKPRYDGINCFINAKGACYVKNKFGRWSRYVSGEASEEALLELAMINNLAAE